MNFFIFIISFIIFEPSKLCAKPLTSCYSFPCPVTYPCQNPYPDPEPACEGVWSPSGPCDAYSGQKISGYSDPCYPCCQYPCPINICLKCEPEYPPNPPSPPRPTPPPKEKQHYMKLLTSLFDLPGSMANILSGECSL